MGTACSGTHPMDRLSPLLPRSTALLIWELTKDKGRGLGSWKSYSAGLWGTGTSHLPQPTEHSPCAQSKVLLLQTLTEGQGTQVRAVSNISVALSFNTHTGTKRFFISNLVMLLKIRNSFTKYNPSDLTENTCWITDKLRAHAWLQFGNTMAYNDCEHPVSSLKSRCYKTMWW